MSDTILDNKNQRIVFPSEILQKNIVFHEKKCIKNYEESIEEWYILYALHIGPNIPEPSEVAFKPF